MNELLEFLSSEEVRIVGIVILTALVLTLIVFIIEKAYYKKKQKHNNTLELNRLVMEEEKNDTNPRIINSTVVTQEIEQNKESKSVVTPIPEVVSISPKKEEPVKEIVKEQEVVKENIPPVIPIEEYQNKIVVEEEKKDDKVSINSIESIYNNVKDEVEQLQYTDAEPNKEEAKEELRKVTEELIKQEQTENNNNIIDLTKFEEEQEENAIISLDELMKKSEVLYQQNEVMQYQDEGNEPISLDDLEKRMNKIKQEITELEQDEVNSKVVEESKVDTIIPVVEQTVEETPKVKLDDLNTIKETPKIYREDIVFKSSPIISPIFGIEKHSQENNLELENTANYEKLDQEIRKTNEFIATLKELQKKLD